MRLDNYLSIITQEAGNHIQAAEKGDPSRFNNAIDLCEKLLSEIEEVQVLEQQYMPNREKVYGGIGDLGVSTVELVLEGMVTTAIKEAYYLIAYSKAQLGELEEAIDAAKKSIEIESKNPNAYYVLSFAYLYKDNFEEAINAATEAIRLDTKNAVAYQNMAAAHTHLGNFKKARSNLNEYFKLHETPSIRARILDLYLKLVDGQLENVVSCATEMINTIGEVKTGGEVVALLPIHAFLGEAYRVQGKKRQAISNYQKAISIMLGFPRKIRNAEMYLTAILAEKGLKKLRQPTHMFKAESIREGILTQYRISTYLQRTQK